MHFSFRKMAVWSQFDWLPFPHRRPSTHSPETLILKEIWPQMGGLD